MNKHTPGPWFADCKGNIWRRDPADLYQNGGSVAGDKAIAAAYQGWSHEGSEGYPVAANARLIAAAPDLLMELRLLLEAVRAHCDTEHPYIECRLAFSDDAIAKATGAQA